MTSRQTPGGLIHTYQGYDPRRFPSPTAPPPDVAGAAMEHQLLFGDSYRMSEDELRDAVRIDPSQIAGLGPSLDALIKMLEERRAKILARYETDSAWKDADARWTREAEGLRAPKGLRDDLKRAVKQEQIADLESLWEAAERRARREPRDPDADPSFHGALLRAIDRLGDRIEIEQLESRYTFTGKEGMTAEQALEVKQELETIDRLLEQLREAQKDAKVGVIDLEELKNFVDDADIGRLQEFGRQIEEYLREQAELQGLERDNAGNYTLTPKAHRLFQNTLLDQIFSELEAARSGRHRGPIEGEGVVELPKTRGYEFGDAPTHIDLPQTVTNAAIRRGAGDDRAGVIAEDIEIHRTRNTPKCATCLLVDMSGSMRQMGQYVACKRMAIAMDGLLRSEYPGDFLQTIGVATFAKAVRPGDVPSLLPKPVTIRDPVVRMRVDMSDPRVSESMVHPHFTNIQHGLSLARRCLAAQDTPNRQIFLITDGLPTAHFERETLYLLYPPDALTEEATMREAQACARDGITINFFLLPSWSQTSEDVAFAQRIAERTNGRVLFAGGQDLDRFVVWDYVNRRRAIIG
ncbi:MAG: hypothetical protein AAFQ71_14540 [Planctomycetota bacterium]